MFDEVAGGEPQQKELYDVDCSDLYNNEYYDKLVEELNQASLDTNLKEKAMPAIATDEIRTEETKPLDNTAEETLLAVESLKKLHTDSDVHDRHRLLIQELFVQSTLDEQAKVDHVECEQDEQFEVPKSDDTIFIKGTSDADDDDSLSVVTNDKQPDTSDSDLDEDDIDTDSIADLNDIHKDLFAVHAPPPPSDDKSVLIERLLNSRSAIFDIPADELNRQVAALEENKHNELVGLVDRVYENREAYKNPDKSEKPIDDDDSDEYVDALTDFDAENSDLTEITAEPNTISPASGITIFCENVSSLLESVHADSGDVFSEATEIIDEEIVEVEEDPISDCEVYRIAYDITCDKDMSSLSMDTHADTADMMLER